MRSLNKRIPTILVAAIIVFAITFAFVCLQPENPRGIESKYNFVVGIGTHNNQSSTITALKAGIMYYRTDISQNTSQEEALSMQNRRYGAHYLGILDYDTLPGGFSNNNWNLTTWNESVRAVVEAYPWIHSWEIWNEPWVPTFQKGYINGSAYNYYQITRSAYLIVKSAEPNATIVCFGGAPIGSYSIYQWYSDVWGYGAGKYCNAISIHAYPPTAGPMNQSLVQTWSAWISKYEALTGKPIWITEFGIPSSSNASVGYSQSNQEEFMVQAFDLFSKYPYIKRVYWYDLWGLSDGPVGNDFGLLNLSDPVSGKPSLAWYSFLSIYNRSMSKG
ncbi:MAG: glycosyl hydrolase [Candidatus Micrarchaeia archaeon]